MTTLPTFFHGEQLLLWFLAIAAVVLGALGVISWWLVRRFKSKFGRRAYGLAALPFLVLLGAIAVLMRAEVPNRGAPEALPGIEVHRLVKDLPTYAPLGYSGLAYFQGKLYVSTNVGLLELEAGRIVKVYRVQEKYSVVSGPWVDRKNQLLWLQDDQTHELLTYNGKQWGRLSMPTPSKGYYSRGDVLEGARILGNAHGFWMASGGSAWHWRPDAGSWGPEPSPARVFEVERMDELIGVLPVEGKVLFLMRHESLEFLIDDSENFKSDTVRIFDGEWRDLPAPSGLRFFAETATVTDDAAYVCTRNGQVLAVTTKMVSVLEAPGNCETLATTSTGRVIASFRSKGLYEYDGQWNRRAQHPYPSGTGEYWAHLAENDSQMAFALTAKPVVDKDHSSPSDYQRKRTAPTQLWAFDGGEWHEVKIP